MGFMEGEGRTQGTLFPVCLEELIPDDHMCRVIDAFVDKLDMSGLGFERADAAETGRPGYDPLHSHRPYHQKAGVQAGRAHFLEPCRLRPTLYAPARPYYALRQRRSKCRPFLHRVRVVR